MIRVTAILEGGYDLETGKEIEKSILITNGSNVVLLPVPADKLKSIIGLFAEEKYNIDPTPKQTKKVKKEIIAQPLFESEPVINPDPTDKADDSFSPGEEYMDADTGVNSL